jgi:hypothetical protein
MRYTDASTFPAFLRCGYFAATAAFTLSLLPQSTARAGNTDLQSPSPVPPRLSWDITFPATFGYETNPRKLSDDSPRPFSGPKSSFLTRLNPGVTLYFSQDDETTWSASYDVLRSYYHDLSDSDRDTHTFKAGVNKDLSETATLGINARDTLLRGNNDTEANVLSLLPSLTWTIGEGREWTLTTLYTFTKADGHNGPKYQEDDFDHIVHSGTVSLNRGFGAWINPKNQKPEFLLNTSINYTFAVRDGEGSNLDLSRHQIGGKLEGWVFPESAPYVLRNLKMKLEYARKIDRFQNGHTSYETAPSATSDPGILRFSGPAQDADIDEIDLTLQLPIGVPADTVQQQTLSVSSRYFKKDVVAAVYGTAHYEKTTSNINGKDYDDLLVVGGFWLKF